MKHSSSYIPNPLVIERTDMGERQYDIYSKLLLDRIVFLGTEINSVSANLIIAQILYLEQSNPTKPILFYINSPGGSVYDGLGIYDIMTQVSCPVHTFCIGMAASMGSLLLTGGCKGHRYAMKHSRIMIHQPSMSKVGGQATDIQIQAKEIQDLKNQLYEIYESHNTKGKTTLDFTTLCERDKFLSPKDAIELGLIDSIISQKKG